MNAKNDDLKHIRSMMERSAKFVSLSGFSGISAGIIALAGAALAHCVAKGDLNITGNPLYDYVLLAVGVVILAGAVGVYFSLRKAKKNNSKFWMPITKQIIKDFAVPMVVGGVFCILLINEGCGRMVASAMLIFYGLALIYAGSRTYRDIKMLGVCEIILGILAGMFIYNGLLFWAIGFGVLHIVYGIVMHFKYDKLNKKS